jgi:hypothetical protein
MTVNWTVEIVFLSIIVIVNTIALLVYWVKSTSSAKQTKAKTKELQQDKKDKECYDKVTSRE